MSWDHCFRGAVSAGPCILQLWYHENIAVISQDGIRLGYDFLKQEASEKVWRKIETRRNIFCPLLPALHGRVFGHDEGSWPVPWCWGGCSFTAWVMSLGPEWCSGPIEALALGAGSGSCSGCSSWAVSEFGVLGSRLQEILYATMTVGFPIFLGGCSRKPGTLGELLSVQGLAVLPRDLQLKTFLSFCLFFPNHTVLHPTMLNKNGWDKSATAAQFTMICKTDLSLNSCYTN